MSQSVIAAKEPMAFDVEEGKTYAWCACGKSSNQPLCDGSHAGTSLSPKVFKAEESKTLYLCMCKQTSNPALCDGSHKSL
ncbi:CDGSH iron-sulfur domain-containing protein [Ekhidna sp.]|uniref:CDGSH iron-sulfur domain-containing protein n=1 Tax=Ekhidna sp. TaxID=2608089 RepID=UPI003CCBB9FB